uniref:Uncharacterized protein n=1 Tax=Oryza meridionalis TaxID=40149 RepID=A0A0E0CWV7_9ORYZ
AGGRLGIHLRARDAHVHAHLPGGWQRPLLRRPRRRRWRRRRRRRRLGVIHC